MLNGSGNGKPSEYNTGNGKRKSNRNRWMTAGKWAPMNLNCLPPKGPCCVLTCFGRQIGGPVFLVPSFLFK